MFEDSLLESGARYQKKGRMGTTLISVVLQCFFIGILILIPLIYTDALPKQQMMSFLVAPPPPPPPPPPPAATPEVKAVAKVVSELDNGALRTPTKIPDKVAMIKEEDTPPPSAGGIGVVGGIGGVGGGTPGGVIGGILSATASATSNIPKMEAPKRVRVSAGVTEGMLLSQQRPPYPMLAKSARIQGHVMLQAIISKDGRVENLRLISGHPMLAPAAIEAVKQWRYRPYLLNGEPVEVETTIDVNFSLSGG